MIFFVMGVAIVFAGLMGALLGLEPGARWIQSDDMALLVARSVIAPTLAAWMIAECVNALRARRLFDRRVARLLPRVLLGVIAGVIGASASAVLLAMANGRVHDVLILAGCSSIGALVVVLPLRRVRAGRCIHCGYDIRSQPPPGSPGWAICPECGASVLPGRDRRAPAVAAA